MILWTSDLTAKGHAEMYLNRDRYIIQFWDCLTDTSNKLLYEAVYKLIMSNVDALYLVIIWSILSGWPDPCAIDAPRFLLTISFSETTYW